MEGALAEHRHGVVAAQHAQSGVVPVGVEGEVAGNLVAAGPHGSLVDLESLHEGAGEHVAIGDHGRARGSAVESQDVVAPLWHTGGVAVDGIEDIGAAAVAQRHDGREREVAGSVVGHARHAGGVAFCPEAVVECEAFLEVGVRLPVACRVALHKGVDHHVAVVALVAAMARIDVDVWHVVAVGYCSNEDCNEHDQC